MTDRPLVSIGMPVHNSRPEWFCAALDGLLEQDFGDFEIIISDNVSDPASAALYRSAAKRDPRIRYIRHEVPIPIEHNFRFLISEAKGEFFFWAADDDVRSPSFIRSLLALLVTHPEAALASFRTAYIDEDGKRVGAVPVHPDTDHPFVRRRVRALTNPGFYMDIYGLYRRSSLLKFQHIRWDAWGLDSILVFAMLLEGPIPRVQEELFSYRVRSSRAESLIAFLIQEKALDTDPRFQWESQRSNDLMMTLLRSDLGIVDKLWCVPTVALILRQSPFIDERIRLMRYRYRRAIAQRSYASALFAAAHYAALSPTAVLRFSAWRLAYDGWKHRNGQ